MLFLPTSEADYVVAIYQSGSITHTFTADLEWVYLGSHVQSPATPGTYTGSGTKTFISGSNYARSEKIVNVKKGDKYATGSGAHYSSGSYAFLYVVGKKA